MAGARATSRGDAREDANTPERDDLEECGGRGRTSAPAWLPLQRPREGAPLGAREASAHVCEASERGLAAVRNTCIRTYQGKESLL